MELPPKLVEQLAMRCLEIATGDPAAVVDQVCVDHPELRAQVRRLLESLQRVGLAQEPPPRPARHPRDLGPYRILRLLGGGGMGQVYLAEQSDLGSRRVALRVLRPELAWPSGSWERFQREMEILSALGHQGICPVYDVGEIDGTPFLTMRHLVGETLAESIGPGSGFTAGSGREAVIAALKIVETVARTLRTAHALGLVHRNIKPTNIMLVAGKGPVLLDFGLHPIGASAYMAPEQVRGQSPDRRSDVYGLGATLYSALTLRMPHEASTREALYCSILEGNVSKASTHNPSVPRDVDVVLETAMDVDADRRYQTAEALAEDLRRIRERKAIRARTRPTDGT